MHPVFIHIPFGAGFNIYTYGVLVALGFLSALLWNVHEGKLRGIASERIFDLGFYNILGAIAGARILYIITEFPRFLKNPLDMIKIWEGGLVFYGGLIACLVISYVYTKKYKISLITMADVFMPGVALGHGIGRLGCLFAGCCYGKTVAGPHFWTLIFPAHPLCLAPTGIPLIPTQIMEMMLLLVIFGLLVGIRRHQRFSGQIFLSYLVLYAIARSILEVFRGDKIRGFLIEGLLSTSQFISGLLVIFAIILYIYLLKKKPNKDYKSVH
ncbi:MAG: prolipoprotein diacylglyceryl transferase [Deltaproteobacteria bacterium RIFCSPLOWO2_12_FULL_50_11]|nr:MAG: prolipoprotein diacylglyceryl transferase [Deltaproteobacteria bacterium GWA2_50_8]OGQ31014.1 MAG: prolipoprotein diacylglyceryl transferase [Deltaproteobacteria bacterium RIFCSPHIGHO2_02_FULL_50_15]OGQ68988.1 MAG: prolipoprotein diacylglyceryl transferase [Deltaproteobacteria bacterium RIFCSPLOWO2_12_FULL_50_11]